MNHARYKSRRCHSFSWLKFPVMTLSMFYFLSFLVVSRSHSVGKGYHGRGESHFLAQERIKTMRVRSDATDL